MKKKATYSVGIDLGTSSSTIAYRQLSQQGGVKTEILEIPQFLEAGSFATLPLLSSFLFLAEHLSFDPMDILPPWPQHRPAIIGEMARRLSLQHPGETILSIKSWISNGEVDRQADILPWGSDQKAKISPFTATRLLLEHLKQAWDTQMPVPLADQIVTIGIPASFDQVARQLTSKAATDAGIIDHNLIEEPQAAFLTWLNVNNHQVAEKLQGAKHLLVCDAGGGTTDFTLIRIDAAENKEQIPELERVAVGRHLLIGGDNMDLALARHLEAGGGSKLDRKRFAELTHRCRTAKEELLSGMASEVNITLQGKGRRLIGDSKSYVLTNQELEEHLQIGFFSEVSKNEEPHAAATGFRELGLPYEDETRLTMHLKEFLAANDCFTRETKPDLILFNGGVFQSTAFAGWVNNQMAKLYPENPPQVLHNPELIRAVAMGCVYQGAAKTGALTIKAGSPRSYCLGFASEKEDKQALAIVDKGLSAGSPIQIQKIFQAQTNQAVAFPLYVCDHAIGTPGIVVDIDSSFRQLPPLSTILHFGRRSQSRQIAVRLEGEYTEIGTLNLQLKAVDTPHQFHLDFQLQAPELSLNEEEVLRISQKQQDYWRTLLKNFHSKAPDAVNGLLKKWEKESDFRRSELDIRDLRGLLDDLLPLADCLQNSRFHEENWLNLAGFLLRPGIGFPGDETRCRRLHTKIHSGLIHARALPVRIQSLILYRRIAAGLTEIQQNEMFRSIKKEFKSHNERELKKTLTFSNQEKAECWRTAVCLEKLPVKEKELLGETLLEGLPLIQNNPMLPWLLGRLITRRPLNASLSHVIPPEAAAIWLNFLFQHSDVVFRSHPLGLALAVHPTGDRAIDLPEDIHQTAMDYLRNWDVDENILMIAEGRALPSREQQSLLLGDALPLGLSM